MTLGFDFGRNLKKGRSRKVVLDLQKIVSELQSFVWLFPFVMGWFWITGGCLYWIFRERHYLLPADIPEKDEWPRAAVIVPCFNEEETIVDTIGTLAHLAYPDFEVIAVNDGSSDRTLELLELLQLQHKFLRVVNLEHNRGKALAMKAGVTATDAEYIICIDGDALLEPHALHWLVYSLTLRPNIGGVTGNPRIRNRKTLLGRLQVGEFSSIIGLIKRTQMVYGRVFTVSGVVCGFRKRALHEVGYWGPDMLTDDIDITWRLQEGGWRIRYEPNAMCWILMPETLRGLWGQRLRWAQGGAEVIIKHVGKVIRGRSWKMLPIIGEYIISVLWAHITMGIMLLWLISLLPFVSLPFELHGIIPSNWGLILAATFFIQSLVSMSLEHRYERGLFRYLGWLIWYPTAYWAISAVTSIVGLYRAIILGRKKHATWVSPDRGIK